MAGRYGMSFAAKMIQQGDYPGAVTEATKAHERDAEDPAPLVDRAAAHALMENYAEAVADLEQALVLDEEAGVLDEDLVDDSYFSALLGLAKQQAAASIDDAHQTLARYAKVRPAGRHQGDATEWSARLRATVAGA